MAQDIANLMIAAPMLVDETTLAQWVMEAVDEGQFDRAKSDLRTLIGFAPEFHMLEELLPVLESLDDDDAERAFFQLTEETTHTSGLWDKLHRIVANKLENQGHAVLAAAAWSGWRDQHGRPEVIRLLRKLGMEQQDLRRQVRRLSFEHYKARAEADPRDAVAWEKLAVKLRRSGNDRDALRCAERALQVDPSRRVAVNLISRVLLEKGRPKDVVKHLERIAQLNPEEAWPWFELAKAYQNQLRDGLGAVIAMRSAYELQPKNREAAEGLRELLRNARKWQELAKHLESMADHTLDARELAEIFEELGHVYAARLESPHDAVEARRQAAQFRDVPSVCVFYWNTLEQEPDAAFWDEAEAFFRVNECWSDLAEILMRKIEGRSLEQSLPKLYEELMLLYSLRLDNPDWQRLVRALADHVEDVRDDDVRERLAESLRLCRETYAQLPSLKAESDDTDDGENSLLVNAVLFVGVFVGSVVVLLLAAWLLLG